VLAVGALVPTRFDVEIEAASLLGRRLVSLGRGTEIGTHVALEAGAAEIRAGLGARSCGGSPRRVSAYVQPGEEDFGIAGRRGWPVGATVVARTAGARDIVRAGPTASSYDEQSPRPLAEASGVATCPVRLNRVRGLGAALPGERFASGVSRALSREFGSSDSEITRGASRPYARLRVGGDPARWRPALNPELLASKSSR